jgi:hypothetical protein
MRDERRVRTRRNTRGLPVGLPLYVRGEEKTRDFNRQSRYRKARPTKLARLVASLNRTKPVMGFEIRYFVEQ